MMGLNGAVGLFDGTILALLFAAYHAYLFIAAKKEKIGDNNGERKNIGCGRLFSLLWADLS